MDDETKDLIKYNVNPKIYKNVKQKFDQMTVAQKNELESSMSWFFLTDNIKKKTREEIQAVMKKMDAISLVVAAIGVVTNILSSYYYINFAKQDEHNGNKLCLS